MSESCAASHGGAVRGEALPGSFRCAREEMMMRALKLRSGAAILVLASSALGSGCRDRDRDREAAPPTPMTQTTPTMPTTPTAPTIQTTVTLAGGTQLTGTLQNSLSTASTRVGAPVSVRTTQPVLLNG